MSSPYRAAHPFDAVDAKEKWLDELPTALPPSAGPNQTMFYFEGHPMIREVLQDVVTLYTSVRRGLPFLRAVATDGIAIEGSAHALVEEVVFPLLHLGRIAKISWPFETCARPFRKVV